MKNRNAIFVVLLLLFASCGQGERPLDEVDPAAAPERPTFDQVNNIIQRECVPCHDGGEEPDLSTCELVVEYRFEIDEQVRKNEMPPGAWPRLTSVERLILARWIEQGGQAECR